jgi:transposase
MLIREEKATELVDRGRVFRNGNNFIVLSLTSVDKYLVTLDPQYCDCPDFETRHADCKHVLACQLFVNRELGGIDQSPKENPNFPPKVWPRPTYEQDWPNYNLAQTNEKDDFQFILADLCRTLQEPEQVRGRPRVRIADAVFAVCFKVFTMLSGRRFASDLREAQRRGHITEAIHHNSISKAMESEELTPILMELIKETSRPLKALETEFAVDSSGFSASKFDRWYNEKYGREQSEAQWVKTHIMVGTRTHIVTAVEILEKRSADGPQFPALVKKTAEVFKIGEVSADKAYPSTENFQTVEDLGGKAYIAFRSNTTGGVGGIYEKMFHLFNLNKETYLKRYHRRSNVESVFSAVKRKFGDSVKSKTPVAMKNEVLAKLVCHNISCLIHCVYELGIDLGLESQFEDEEPMILKFPG